MAAPIRVLWNTSRRIFLDKCNISARFLSTSSSNRYQDPPHLQYTDYEVSKEDFKYVKKILPPDTIPEPPEISEPTPSGWVPQTDNTDKSYWIRRTKNHMLPVYLTVKDGGTNRITTVKKIEGDIWEFDKELRNALEKMVDKKVLTQINEVTRIVKVKGNYVREVGQFLIREGL